MLTVLGAFAAPVHAESTGAPRVTVKAGKPDPRTGTVRVRITAVDADDSVVRMQVPAATAKGSIRRRSWPAGSTSGSFTYTPTAAARHAAARDTANPAEKADRFTLTIIDAQGRSESVPVSIKISPRNSVPVADPIVSAPDASGVVTGSLRATDADGDPLTYAVTVMPARGSVVASSDGTFIYTPSVTQAMVRVVVNASSSDCFSVSVGDGYGGTAHVPVCVQSQDA